MPSTKILPKVSSNMKKKLGLGAATLATVGTQVLPQKSQTDTKQTSKDAPKKPDEKKPPKVDLPSLSLGDSGKKKKPIIIHPKLKKKPGALGEDPRGLPSIKRGARSS